jgi:DNA-binding MarR family transcriptional regulator
VGCDDEAIARIEYQVALLLRRAELAQADRPDAERLVRSAYLLLDELEARGPLGVAALAEAMRADVSTVSRQIVPLDRHGWVRRLPNPEDGRGSLVEITESGREQLQATREKRYAAYCDVLADWTEEERQMLADSLAHLNEAMAARRGRQLKAGAAQRS